MYTIQIANQADAQTLLDALANAPLSFARVQHLLQSVLAQLQEQEAALAANGVAPQPVEAKVRADAPSADVRGVPNGS